MAFDPSRLKTQLLNTQLQNKDTPLYQLLDQMIDALSKLFLLVGGTAGTSGGGTTINNNITNVQQLMFRNQVASGPQSLLMGIPTGLIPDNSVDHVVMSDGATPIPSPVDDGFGNFIYIQYTP